MDRGNNRIQVFDMNGKFISKHGVLGGEKEEFNLPCGITIDLKGRWIISDLGNDRIQVRTDLYL